MSGDQPSNNGPVKTRPARRPPPSIGRYSSKIFAELAGRTNYVDPALASRWVELVGPEIAALCRPGRLTGGRIGATLEVFAPSGAAASRAQFEAETMRRRLNEYLGPGRVGRITVLQRAAKAAAEPAGPLGAALSRFRASVTQKK